MKYILIGQCSEKTGGGPSNIMRGMKNELQHMEVDIQTIFLDEHKSKKKIVLECIKTLLTEKNALVNVHTRGYFLPLFVYLLSRLNPHNYYCLTIHGFYFVEAQINGNTNRIYCWVERFLYKKFPNLVCVSEMLMENIVNKYHRMQGIYVIPNATDASSMCRNIKTNTVNFIMTGGLRKTKGIEECLNLMQYLVFEKKLNARLTVYGAESEIYNKEWLDRQLKEKGLEKCVLFGGYVNGKQTLYDLVAQADFQLCLSHYDTFNVAIAESLVLGCPCISSDMCGASYLIKQNFNGLVVNLENENMNEQIYQYIGSFSENTKKREKIYESRNEYGDQLSWRHVCESYLQLAEEGN